MPTPLELIEDEDEARIEAVKRWHIFNRDPTDEQWRNIDALLATLGRSRQEIEEDLAKAEEEHRDEIRELERDYKSRIDDLRAELDDRDKELSQLENRAAIIERIATRQAELLGADHVAALQKRLKALAEQV